jgi:threonine aldolase
MTVQEPETNLVSFDPAGAGMGAGELQAALRAEGIAVSALGGRLRACTHLDVEAPMIGATLEAIRRLLRA